MKLHCPDCGQPISAEDINLDTSLAKCRRCNSVFSFSDSLKTQSRQAPQIKPVYPRSNRIRVEDFAGVLRIRYRWFTPGHIFLAFFCIAWDSFLIFWYTTALTQKHTPWLMIVFPVAHLAVGIGLTYLTLAGFVNSTTVTLGQEQLSVRHSPFPWPGNRTLPTLQILQLFCDRNVSYNRDNGTNVSYNLYAVLANDVKIRLLSGFTDVSEPRMIEHLIEERLRLSNRAVEGEFRD
jgi:hypothetical protein